MTTLDEIRKQLTKIIEQSLKDLIETKHLYQSVTLPLDDLTEAARAAAPTGPPSPGNRGKFIAEAWENTVRLLACGAWVVEPAPSGQQVEKSLKFDAGELPLLILTMPSVRMYCDKCGDRVAFNAVNVSETFKVTIPRASRVLIRFSLLTTSVRGAKRRLSR